MPNKSETKKTKRLGNGNLIPIKKGEVRNPKGRPVGAKHSMASYAKMLLKKNPPDVVWEKLIGRGFEPKDARGPNAKANVMTLQALAYSGDLKAMKMLVDLAEPQAHKVELSGMVQTQEVNASQYRALMQIPRAREALKIIAEELQALGIKDVTE